MSSQLNIDRKYMYLWLKDTDEYRKSAGMRCQDGCQEEKKECIKY